MHTDSGSCTRESGAVAFFSAVPCSAYEPRHEWATDHLLLATNEPKVSTYLPTYLPNRLHPSFTHATYLGEYLGKYLC
jgi:hypothetical protein